MLFNWTVDTHGGPLRRSKRSPPQWRQGIAQLKRNRQGRRVESPVESYSDQEVAREAVSLEAAPPKMMRKKKTVTPNKMAQVGLLEPARRIISPDKGFATLQLTMLLTAMQDRGTSLREAVFAVRDAAQDGELEEIMKSPTDFDSKAEAVLDHVRETNEARRLEEALAAARQATVTFEVERRDKRDLL